MKSIELFFAQPWLLLLAVPAAAFVLLAPRLLRREKEKSRTDRAATILRAAAVALLAVIAAGPGGTRYLTERQTVVLLDQSASMEPVRAQADAWAQEAKRDEHTTVLPFAALDEAGAIASDGTDIAAAIDEAASRFAGPGGRRIILISDGVQTQGDALTAAEAAAQAGVRLDAVQMKPEFPAPQAELAAFELPAEAMEGRHMEAAVTVLTDTQGEAALRIWDGETLLHEQRVALTAGRQTFACAIEAGAVGAHTLRAEVALPGDTIAENDSLTATMNVSRGEKVLLVDGTGTQAQQLEHRCGHSLLRKGVCCLHRLRAQLAVGDQQQPRLCSLWLDCPRSLRVEGGQLALSSARIAHAAHAGVFIQAFVQRAAHLLIGSRRVQGDARHAGKHGDIE